MSALVVMLFFWGLKNLLCNFHCLQYKKVKSHNGNEHGDGHLPDMFPAFFFALHD
jgi:hypothetical protein